MLGIWFYARDYVGLDIFTKAPFDPHAGAKGRHK
jgi:hypothetical protein